MHALLPPWGKEGPLPHLQCIPLSTHDGQLAVSVLQPGPQLPCCLHVLSMLQGTPADGGLQPLLQLMQLLLVLVRLLGCRSGRLVLLVLQLLLQAGELGLQLNLLRAAQRSQHGRHGEVTAWELHDVKCKHSLCWSP